MTSWYAGRPEWSQIANEPGESFLSVNRQICKVKAQPKGRCQRQSAGDVTALSGTAGSRRRWLSGQDGVRTRDTWSHTQKSKTRPARLPQMLRLLPMPRRP